MVAYTEGEPGGGIVAALLSDPSAVYYAHSINLCEVYYQAIRCSDSRTAKAAILALYRDGVIERRDMSRRLWQRVAAHKSRGRISLADCICIALAQDLSAAVVTSNHAEFGPLIPLGIVPIRFIR